MTTDSAYDEDAVTLDTHQSMDSQFGEFQEMLLERGWQIGPGFVNIECGSSYRAQNFKYLIHHLSQLSLDRSASCTT